MTATVTPSLVRELQAKFEYFARHELPDDPLYVAVTLAVAARPGWAAWLADAPATQQRPNLWLAALHDRLLELVDGGERPALADYYPSVGGQRAPDAAFDGALAAVFDAQEAALRARIATRTTQTNEVGRCAVLWPILRAIAERTGRTRIALLDVGTSAGLNLGVDRWRYRYVDDRSGATLAERGSSDPGAPEITCRMISSAEGAAAAPARESPMPEIVSRLGIDPEPIAVDDDAAVRWLRACLWPSDRVRRARLDAAVAIARVQRWPVRAASDTLAAIAEWLDTLEADVTPVIFNSWVLAYFDAAALDAYAATLQRRIVGRGVVWVSAESPELSRRWWPELPPASAPASDGSVDAAGLENASTAWVVASSDGRGGVEWRLAARSHAHGRWLQWTFDSRDRP